MIFRTSHNAAVSNIARSLGFLKTAGSPTFLAVIRPSLSPSHEPCSDATVGAMDVHSII